MMTPQSAQSLSIWLLNNHPGLFYKVAKHANPALGDFSDVLSNVGGAFSSAVSSVGNWLSNPQNVQSLTALAGTYFASQAASSAAQAQAQVLQTQTQRAQAGQPVAPITYTTDANGQPVAVYTGTPSSGLNLGTQVQLPSAQIGYTVSPQTLASLQPSFLQKYGLWVAGGLGLLVVGALALS